MTTQASRSRWRGASAASASRSARPGVEAIPGFSHGLLGRQEQKRPNPDQASASAVLDAGKTGKAAKKYARGMAKAMGVELKEAPKKGVPGQRGKVEGFV